MRARRLAQLALLAGVVASCGSSPATVHGTVDPATAGLLSSTTYASCSTASPGPGTQVTVTDPSGKVIGSGTLGLWSHAHVTMAGTSIYLCEMPFTIAGVPAESRYGFQVQGVPGTLWVTSLAKPVHLVVNSQN